MDGFYKNIGLLIKESYRPRQNQIQGQSPPGASKARSRSKSNCIRKTVQPNCSCGYDPQDNLYLRRYFYSKVLQKDYKFCTGADFSNFSYVV